MIFIHNLIKSSLNEYSSKRLKYTLRHVDSCFGCIQDPTQICLKTFTLKQTKYVSVNYMSLLDFSQITQTSAKNYKTRTGKHKEN